MSPKRCTAIIEALRSGKHFTVNQLALLCSASYKTIRQDIAELNSWFEKKGMRARIVSQSGVGVSLRAEDSAEVEAALSGLGSVLNVSDNSVRPDLQAAFAVLQNDYTRLDDLCEQLSFSKSAVSALLKSVRRELEGYGIEIKTRPHYGMYSAASERSVRRFICESMLPLSLEQRSALCGETPQKTAELMEEAIAAVKSFSLPLADNALKELLVNLQTAAIRLARGHTLEDEVKDPPSPASPQYVLAGRLLRIFAAGYRFCFSDAEIGRICRIILSKQSLGGDSESDDEEARGELDRSVRRILDLILEKYKIDLGRDIELYSSLMLHLAPLISRASIGEFSKNPIKDEIKVYYPLPFEMAVDAALLLREDMGITLDEHETSYLAIYLHLALERFKRSYTPKRVLVVCPAGRGMSQLMAHNIKEKFGDYISELEVCGFYDLDNIDFSRYDYLFTTSPIDRTVPLPVVSLPIQLYGTDIEQVKDRLMDSAEGATLRDMTPRSMFLGQISASNKEDALKKIVGILHDRIDLPDNFIELVLERDRAFPTELDNLIAFPHPMRDCGAPSFLSVAVLTRPVQWTTKQVRIVLLGWVEKGSSSRMQRFYRQFSRLVSNRENAVRLIDKPTFETYLAIADEIIKEV